MAIKKLEKMKKIIVLSLLSVTVLLSEDLEYRGSIGFESAFMEHDIAEKRNKQSALYLELALKQKISDGQFVFNTEAFLDKEDKNRRYVDVNDLYYKHEFENSSLLVGRNTRFWGAMEFYNHTDVFNTKDWRDDPFDYDSKIGANNLAYTHYFENSELAFIVKVGQEKQRIQDKASVNNFLPTNYSSDLQTQKNKNRPTLYAKYSGSAEETQFDYAVIYQNGYDEQRYLAPVGITIAQHAYLVDKVMGYATLVSGETIYKTELAYTQSDELQVSDYAQYAVGLEHTFYGVWGKSDLGVLAEYYKYDDQDASKLGAKDLGNLFQDDLTLGFRLTVNDSADSDVLGGLSIDQENQEKLIFVEYNTRIYDNYKVGVSYQHLAPKSRSVFKELDLLQFEFGYYF
ncbi:MAG: Unknown protein [uncultured Sulfurovum sp.]|uniref:Alginate export domain-containing protein n=1 Tax=uncultured Sulfurovum sp. TaxID=269237 RepID=A0A6S6T2R3_9BACT|nr:MAG: Unknown protein [uncultured Sulfurovum sp.]